MFEINGLKLLFNGRCIYEALDKIQEIICQDREKAVIQYRSLGYAQKLGLMQGPHEMWLHIINADDFKLINQNVLCIDKNGHEVWRIESPVKNDRRPDSFIYVVNNKDTSGRWLAVTHLGHECELDIHTGKLSNIRHYAVK